MKLKALKNHIFKQENFEGYISIYVYKYMQYKRLKTIIFKNFYIYRSFSFEVNIIIIDQKEYIYIYLNYPLFSQY